MEYRDLMMIEYVNFIGLTELDSSNSLRLSFDRYEASHTPEPFQLSDDVILPETYPIESTKAPIIQLDFESYIGYSVINESFTSWDEYERFEGKKTFRIYSKSRFLDYISNATFAIQEYPGPYLHYGIVCLDHIVNVVTISEPKVREINRQ
ncbi:hypothetical protein HFN20_24935 [Paenibacillus dendritiformis]|uniref:hypothetical protein n=1 Tax=Paenibacillus dendritiformis TaxID=130049 RepID=UPI00143CC3B1|nr:hypothetical protein [Paenibacillus dendritiformis]NKI24401.1 hypothetical protein [Paenibacillus dendritiformis]NRG00609.1 hypothetical protein [Paenibacillus dendritiformis]